MDWHDWIILAWIYIFGSSTLAILLSFSLIIIEGSQGLLSIIMLDIFAFIGFGLLSWAYRNSIRTEEKRRQLISCTRFRDALKDKKKCYSFRELLNFLHHLTQCDDCWEAYNEYLDSDKNHGPCFNLVN